jgi:hypothetical protein
MAISSKGFHKLAAFHGLDPEKHSDSDVDDAIKNSVTEDDLDALNNRAQQAEQQLVDQDLAKYSNRIGKDPKVIARWKETLLSNREATIEMLEAIQEPKSPNAGKEPIHNRTNAKTPESLNRSATPEVGSVEATRLNSLIRNRAEKLEKDGMRSQMAWIRAAEQIPDEIAAGLHK